MTHQDIIRRGVASLKICLGTDNLLHSKTSGQFEHVKTKFYHSLTLACTPINCLGLS